MKTRETKGRDLDVLRTSFSASKTAFVVEFKGLTVVAVDELRKKIREAGGSYTVIKNTLARKASTGSGLEALSVHFRGPTALVRADAEPARIAKALADFAKTNPALVVKGGVVEGTSLGPDECRQIAEIPSREALLGKLAYLLQSPMQRLASVLAAPQRNLAVVIDQVAQQKAQ